MPGMRYWPVVFHVLILNRFNLANLFLEVRNLRFQGSLCGVLHMR